jgi:chromosome segregation ATPase
MNITLTPEQVRQITLPALEDTLAKIADLAKEHAKEIALIKRIEGRKLEAAKAKSANWKMRYTETRSELLKARAEVYQLRKELEY